MLKLPNKIHIRIIFFLGLTLLLSACGRPKGILTQAKMVDVITDLHTLDGSLAAKEIMPYDFETKSKYYNSVLKKYGITAAEFDSSVVWYTKNPKKYERVYEKVFVRLTSLDEDIKKGKFHPVDSTELRKIRTEIWSNPVGYSFSKDSARTRLHFITTNKSLMLGDVYILRFRHFIAPTDSSSNPYIVFRIHYLNGKIDSVFTHTYNDSLTRRYTLRLKAYRKLKISNISGELLGSTAYKGDFNARIDSISLVRVYDPQKQDSLRVVVRKADPEKYPVPPAIEAIKKQADSIRTTTTDSLKKSVE